MLSTRSPLIGEFHNPETHLIPTIIYKAMHNKRFLYMGKILIPLMELVSEIIFILKIFVQQLKNQLIIYLKIIDPIYLTLVIIKAYLIEKLLIM